MKNIYYFRTIVIVSSGVVAFLVPYLSCGCLMEAQKNIFINFLKRRNQQPIGEQKTLLEVNSGGGVVFD